MKGSAAGPPDSLKTDGAADALFYAEGLQPPVDPVAAKGALLRVSLWIETDGIVRTGVGADAAAGALLTVDQHNPIRSLVNRPGRTRLPAARIRAVPAGVGLPGEAEPRIRAGGTLCGCAAAGEHPHPRARLQLVLHLAA